MSMTQLWPYLLSLMEQPVLSLNPEEKHRVLADYRALHTRMLDNKHCFAREVIKTCLQSFYLDLCQLLEERGARRETFNTRTFNIFYRFMQLLSRNFAEQRSVNWYADQLQLTPKYLSQLIKNVSGRTVGQWVSVLVVMEIKSLLRNTDLSIKEISSGMNFPSQSLIGALLQKLHRTLSARLPPTLTPLPLRRGRTPREKHHHCAVANARKAPNTNQSDAEAYNGSP